MRGPATAKTTRSATSSRQAETDLSQTVLVLLYQIVARSAEAASAEVQRFGFNIKGIRVLVTLLGRGATRVGELGDAAALDSSTLSHLLRRLHRKGLIERTRLEDDNRSVEVTLTSKGRTTAKLCQAVSSRIEATVLEGLSAAQVEALRQQLLKISVNVEQKLRPAKAKADNKSGRGLDL